jgi:hypothetical protein
VCATATAISCLVFSSSAASAKTALPKAVNASWTRGRAPCGACAPQGSSGGISAPAAPSPSRSQVSPSARHHRRARQTHACESGPPCTISSGSRTRSGWPPQHGPGQDHGLRASFGLVDRRSPNMLWTPAGARLVSEVRSTTSPLSGQGPPPATCSPIGAGSTHRPCCQPGGSFEGSLPARLPSCGCRRTAKEKAYNADKRPRPRPPEWWASRLILGAYSPVLIAAMAPVSRSG